MAVGRGFESLLRLCEAHLEDGRANRVVAALVASLAVACALLPGRAEAQDARPNILVFVTDDQRPWTRWA